MNNYKVLTVLVLLNFIFACSNSDNTKKGNEGLAIENESISKGTELVKKEVSSISFIYQNLDSAAVIAKAENRPIFVDVYIPNCPPCKVMDKDVFVLPEVADYYNKNFINVKLNAREPAGRKLARNWGVNSYPTFVYLGESNEQLSSNMGMVDGKLLIEFGEDALEVFNR